jgi:hypothetical protein
MPIAIAALIAFSAAKRAANGVLLRDPLNPTDPALPQTTVFPWVSVTVTMVLLKVAVMCTWPADNDFFAFRPVERRVERSPLVINPRLS